MSRSQLHRKLKALTGCSPGDLILQYRLHKAKKLIYHNRNPLKTIARECGFSSYSAFWQAYTRYYDQNPSEDIKKYYKINISWKLPPDEDVAEQLLMMMHRNRWVHQLLVILIREVANASISTKDIAQELNMSNSNLLRKTNKHLQITPMKLKQYIQMMAVLEKIQDSSLMITEIAYQLGFSDQAHLSRTFKSNIGQSPSQFRKQKFHYTFYTKMKKYIQCYRF